MKNTKYQTLLQIIKIVYLVSFSFLIYTSCIAQQYYFDNYSVKEGLAQSKVYDVLQDSKGYFWIGTAAGLSKFDGKHFINFTQENGLAKNGVQKIIQDKHGNLWFGHLNGGLSRLKDDSIQNISMDTVVADITTIAEDNEGNIWVGTYGSGAFKILNPDVLSIKNLDFIQFKEGEDKLSNDVFSIYKTHDGTLYFIINDAIKYFDNKENSFEKYQPKNLSQFFQFTCMFEDYSGDMWYGTNNGGLYKSNKDGSYTIFTEKDGLVSNIISTINEDKNHSIWVGSWSGISIIKNNIIKNFILENGLPDLKIKCIKEDFEGNILIGTYENGLCVFKGNRFISYSDKDGIKGSQVSAVLQDSEGKFWFGTNDGLTICTKSGSSFTTHQYYNEENGKLQANHIKFIKEDKNKDIWIGTENSGILQYDKKNKSFGFNFLINGYMMQNNMVTAMEIDYSNNLWIGTVDGLINYDINKDEVALITTEHGLPSNEISALFSDSHHQLWVGSQRLGLSIFNQADSIFKIVETGFDFTPSCITESTDKKIWIGTEANGVLVFEDKKLIGQYKIADGLLADYITSIIAGINGDVYIGTSRGINKYDTKLKTFSSYSEKAGFIGIEVKKNACVNDKEGNIWFGTIKGATVVDILSESETKLQPITYISKLRINLKDSKLVQNLILNYDENSLIFDYTSISLTDPDAIVYKVMLQGADKDWGPEINQTTASYSGLKPGKYTFKVIAKNSFGIWNAEPVSYTFTIKPPFWESPWFLFIIGIIGLASIFTFIKVRESKLVKEKNILENKVKERTIEISEKNKELELKNKNITDSIKYAKRIQDAILPDIEHIKEILNDFFIIYMPRDIVSGDYYWVSKKDEHLVIVAADCTGHGVPGAFMSMLGITLLDEIVNKKNIFDAKQILDEMRSAVIKSLKQKGLRGETQDGMDISLCSINTKTLEMQYSGAYNPIYLIRNNEIIKYKANRMPIGIYYKHTMGFTNHTIQLQQNDLIYLFTDGYLDQFNDKNGEKLMITNFKRYLQECCTLPINEQKIYLENKLIGWKGKAEQVDDILVFAVKVDFN